MSYWEVEVRWSEPELDPRRAEVLTQIGDLLRSVGGAGDRLRELMISDVYYISGDQLSADVVQKISGALLVDPVAQSLRIVSPSEARTEPPEPESWIATVVQKPGVMDPIEESFLQGLDDLGVRDVRVRTGARYLLSGDLNDSDRSRIADSVLANPVIQDVFWSGEGPRPEPFRSAAPYVFEKRSVTLEGLSSEELERLSGDLGLSLKLREMEAVRDHFAALGRAPTDVELETLAQTWSEHCCHKTLTSPVHHVSARFPDGNRTENLLKATIVRATQEINAPWCLSVFKDNAGVIAFDDEYGISFKVETHNHPSAIEPYGGAGTGIGGVLRDTLGTGLGAKPIVNTDVFCFGPPDLPASEVPPGALHPLRVLRGVVGGVRDYGNRMGIPTASGAVYFDRRYVGNPIVFCGSVGIIPRDAIDKEVRPGDRIYVVGGRTGRDGIHGATFSSVELTEESETVSSGAVQIGNPITEKKMLDVLLEARRRRLFRCVTDCGAGGLSSAVGEMGEETGARVQLENVPLKYEGLSYWEIWISEAQERIVLAVPPEKAAELEALAQSEEVECTDIGEFTDDRRLVLSFHGSDVCDLSMEFLHGGRPKWVRESLHRSVATEAPDWARWVGDGDDLGKMLHRLLAAPNIASKEWIIRQYDHEVQGASVLKPIQGVGAGGPGDGVAFLPRLDSHRAIAIGCGMNPCYGDLDPYRMALSAVDEALRNVVAVGGNPSHTALLDNFCWGNTDRPETLGSLVEAAHGCADAAIAFGTPFVSGKDSLNNEFRVGDETIAIPPTLLLSSVSVVDDARSLVSMDLKMAQSVLVLVGKTYEELGGSHLFQQLAVSDSAQVPDVRLDTAPAVHARVHDAIVAGSVLSCHDLAEGGLAVAIAEMAFAGKIGASIDLRTVEYDGNTVDAAVLFSESNTRYLLEVERSRLPEVRALLGEISHSVIGETQDEPRLRISGLSGEIVVDEGLDGLQSSWRRTLEL